MCMCMHNRYMNMHIGHYPILELRCICTIYTCTYTYIGYVQYIHVQISYMYNIYMYIYITRSRRVHILYMYLLYMKTHYIKIICACTIFTCTCAYIVFTI